jgi:hypothetical protein
VDLVDPGDFAAVETVNEGVSPVVERLTLRSTTGGSSAMRRGGRGRHPRPPKPKEAEQP